MMERIKFHKKSFIGRELLLPEFGQVLISVHELNNLLVDENGSYESEEAIMIDEKIFYFVTEEEIKYSSDKLTKLILSEI